MAKFYTPFCLISVLFFSSCFNSRQLGYFQDLSDTSRVHKLSLSAEDPLRLQPDDEIQINISSISPMPRGMPKPNGVHPLVVFDLDNPDMKAFDDFYPKLQDTIRDSVEWKARASVPKPAPAPAPAPAGATFEDMTDDIPFITSAASFDMESRFDRRIRRMRGR